MFANRMGHTDISPYEVIKHNTERKLTIRLMTAELDPSWKPECHVGGFCCNVSNNSDQKWIITPDPNGYETVIRKNKHGVWKDVNGNTYKISDVPVKFYDYNF